MYLTIQPTIEPGGFRGVWRRSTVPFEEKVKDIEWAREADEKFKQTKTQIETH